MNLLGCRDQLKEKESFPPKNCSLGLSKPSKHEFCKGKFPRCRIEGLHVNFHKNLALPIYPEIGLIGFFHVSNTNLQMCPLTFKLGRTGRFWHNWHVDPLMGIFHSNTRVSELQKPKYTQFQCQETNNCRRNRRVDPQKNIIYILSLYPYFKVNG